MAQFVARLTDKRLSFAGYLARGYAPADSAKLAGYAHPEIQCHALMREPGVLAALREERQRRIEGELSGLALTALHDILIDKTLSPAVRERAARTVLDYAGHSAKAAGAGDESDKPINEMTVAELEAIILRSRAVLAAAEAPLITGTATATARPAGYELFAGEGA